MSYFYKVSNGDFGGNSLLAIDLYTKFRSGLFTIRLMIRLIPVVFGSGVVIGGYSPRRKLYALRMVRSNSEDRE